MRMRAACLPLLLVSILPMAQPVHAQAGQGRVGARLSCDGPETALVSMLAYERDRGTPKAEMVAKAERLPENDGSRLIAQNRIDDVYLDAALTPATITAFRSKKCQLGLLLRNHAPYAEATRERLLQCQAAGTPGARAFRNCIHELIGYLETRSAETPSMP